MSKENNNVNSTIEDLRKKLKKAEKEEYIKCDHKKANGKLKLEPVHGQRGVFKCKKCGQEFSMDRIERASLIAAAELLHDAIQQIRCYTENSEQEKTLVRQLGELDYSISESIELYDKTIKAVGKKKDNGKKKKDNNSSGGRFGWDGVSFSGKR